MNGDILQKQAYGERKTTSWEMDHIHPKSKGGTDAISNLQPLQWKSNRQKSDKYDPVYEKKCLSLYNKFDKNNNNK